MTELPLLFSAAEAAPAGGAETRDIVIATAIVGAVMVGLVAIALAHRSGRTRVFDRLGTLGNWVIGLPAWVTIPMTLWIACGAMLLFGLHWDEASHLDNGRDAGPLANPSHYLLIFGILGFIAAGFLAIVLPRHGEDTGPASIRLAEGWNAPLGGIVILASACFGALGFPMDDLSHRIFGQDVTLWGTTHVWMIAGMVLTFCGLLILIVEGQLAVRTKGPEAIERTPWLQRFAYVGIAGAALLAFGAFQGEFDYGIPQFRLLFHPVLIAFAAGTSLVFVRILGGRGAALRAVGLFIVLRTIFALSVGPDGIGHTLGMFPLYLGEALVVELVAARVSPVVQTGRFAAFSALGIGTAGVVSEYLWTNAAMPIGWPAQMLPEAIALATIAALAGAAIGVFFASALELRPRMVRSREVRGSVIAGIIAIGAVFAYLLPTSGAEATAHVSLTETRPAPEREVRATVRFEPASAVADADWLRLIAYQGGERLVGGELDQIGPGTYRTTESFPVHGTWKSAIRFHRGSQLAAVPIFLPEDAEIPAAEVPATASFTRELAPEEEILLREMTTDLPAWVMPLVWLLIGGGILGLVFAIGWALVRLATSAHGGSAGHATPAQATPGHDPSVRRRRHRAGVPRPLLRMVGR